MWPPKRLESGWGGGGGFDPGIYQKKNLLVVPQKRKLLGAESPRSAPSSVRLPAAVSGGPGGVGSRRRGRGLGSKPPEGSHCTSGFVACVGGGGEEVEGRPAPVCGLRGHLLLVRTLYTHVNHDLPAP